MFVRYWSVVFFVIALFTGSIMNKLKSVPQILVFERIYEELMLILL